MTDESIVLKEAYQLVSIGRIAAPAGAEGSDWYRYVIGQGSNKIEGFRRGERAAVETAVDDIVVQLNERRAGRRGRVNLVPRPKTKAKAAK
jgi:hypothetical protein